MLYYLYSFSDLREGVDFTISCARLLQVLPDTERLFTAEAFPVNDQYDDAPFCAVLDTLLLPKNMNVFLSMNENNFKEKVGGKELLVEKWTKSDYVRVDHQEAWGEEEWRNWMKNGEKESKKWEKYEKEERKKWEEYAKKWEDEWKKWKSEKDVDSIVRVNPMMIFGKTDKIYRKVSFIIVSFEAIETVMYETCFQILRRAP
jgi:hypothetical protein